MMGAFIKRNRVACFDVVGLVLIGLLWWSVSGPREYRVRCVIGTTVICDFVTTNKPVMPRRPAEWYVETLEKYWR